MASRPLAALSLGLGVSITSLYNAVVADSPAPPASATTPAYRNWLPSWMSSREPSPEAAPVAPSSFAARTPVNTTSDANSEPEMNQSNSIYDSANRFSSRSSFDASTGAISSTGSTSTEKPSSQARNQNYDDEMVPITPEFLREHYNKYPNPVVNPKLLQLRDEVSALQVRIAAKIRSVPPSSHHTVTFPSGVVPDAQTVIQTILREEIPSSMDSSMYCARCACEEAADRCQNIPALQEFSPRFLAIANSYESFQSQQKEHISDVVKEFLPKDFRGNIFTTFRHRSERGNAQAVDELLKNGGTIREKYQLLWDQQWKRRENLAMVGNASGIWKFLVKFLAGVPEPLLTFAKDINAPNGPTEQLRLKFGGALEELVRFSIEVNALCAAATYVEDVEDLEKVRSQLESGLTLYELEQKEYVALLQVVIVNSPFFIRPDQIASLKVRVDK